MKCIACGGKGYREEQHGLIQIGCPECKATGIVEDVVFTGLQFQLAGQNIDGYSIDDLWVMAKEEAVANMEFPQVAIMPCGNTQTFSDSSAILNLPIKDIPCPCGNPNHAIVRFIEVIDKGLTEENSWEAEFAKPVDAMIQSDIEHFQKMGEIVTSLNTFMYWNAIAQEVSGNLSETEKLLRVNNPHLYGIVKEVKDDNGDGTKQPDKPTRSRNTGKPTKPKKPKTKKAARSKAG